MPFTVDDAALCSAVEHGRDLAGFFDRSSYVYSGAVLDLALRHRAEIVGSLLKLNLDFSFCAPVRVAVESCVPIEIFNQILQDTRIDINTGCPLRLAVLLDRVEHFDRLMEEERINPNKGSPLFYAVSVGRLRMTRQLLERSVTLVNRFTPGHGTTPLCEAVEKLREGEFTALLSHTRIDVNRGWLITPLWAAA